MKLIPVGRGRFAQVDDEDFEFLVGLGPWHEAAGGYAIRNQRKAVSETVTRMHCFVLKVSPGREVDHIDGNRLNNQRSNLREASRSDNMGNCGLRSTNQSGYKGVIWRKDTKRWSANIVKNYKQHSLGCFDTVEEAAEAYDKAAIELFGDFALTNKTLKSVPSFFAQFE